MNLDQLLLKNIQQYSSDSDIRTIQNPIAESINAVVNSNIKLEYENDEIIKSLTNDGIYKFGNILDYIICEDITNYLNGKIKSSREFPNKGLYSYSGLSELDLFCSILLL